MICGKADSVLLPSSWSSFQNIHRKHLKTYTTSGCLDKETMNGTSRRHIQKSGKKTEEEDTQGNKNSKWLPGV